MTKRVITIDCNDSVLNACKLYHNCEVGSLIVMDKEQIVGIVTERDIIERLVLTDKDPKDTKIEDIMSPNIKTIPSSATIEEAADIMRKNEIKKLPVTSNEKIVGIITVTDIANEFPEFLKELTLKSPKLV